MADSSFFVIECKNEVLDTRDSITKTEAGQLAQSMEWFRFHYPASTGTPVLIHPTRTLASDAELVSGMRVMEEAKLETLKKKLREFSKQLGEPSVGSSPAEVAQRLEQFGFRGEKFLEAYTQDPK